MIPFSDLMKQVDGVFEKTKEYTNISVSYSRFESGNIELQYKFYQPDFSNTIGFDSVQELQTAMDNIINSPKDKGVKV